MDNMTDKTDTSPDARKQRNTVSVFTKSDLHWSASKRIAGQRSLRAVGDGS